MRLFSELEAYKQMEQEEDPSLVNFAERKAPHRLQLLETILREIDYPYGQEVFVDPTLPLNVGGYYSPDTKEIHINMYYVLFGTYAQIKHVLVHEGIHAGIYTDGVEVMDEPLTELLTKKIVDSTEVETGYDQLVEKLWPYIADLSVEEITTVIEQGSKESLYEFMEMIILHPYLEDAEPGNFSFENINKRIYEAWPLIKELFPRAINELVFSRISADMETNASVDQIGMDVMLDIVAERLISESGTEILIDFLLSEQIILSEEHAWEILADEGFLYLTDRIEDRKSFYEYLNSLAERKFVPKSPNPLLAGQTEA